MAWFFTSFGGFSVVLQDGKSNQWKVRSRSRQDLERLISKANLAGQKVIETFGSDYRYRLVINADELSAIFRTLEQSITYGNYKSKLQATPGMEKLCDVAHGIWHLWAGKFGGAYQRQPSQRYLIDDDSHDQTLAHGPKPTRPALDDAEPPAPATIRDKPGNGRKRNG
jgi:hypothetical protein